MTKPKMKNIPKTIYLQIGEDCDAKEFKELHEVSWCENRIYENDIVYELMKPRKRKPCK